MKMFVIDNAGKIAAIQPDSVTEAQMTFKTECELAGVTSEWPSKRLVEIWNQLPGVTAVRKFTDRKSAVSRIWKGVQALEPAVAPHAAPSTDEEGRVGQEAEERRRRAQSQQNRNRAGTTSTRGRRHAGRYHERHRLAGAQRSRVHQRCAGQAHGLDGRISKARRREARLFRRKLIQTRANTCESQSTHA